MAALPHLETAVQANPSSFENQFNLGRVLAAQGRFAQAIPHFEQAAVLSGGREALILSLLAGAYGEVGRFPEAAQTARRALDVTPAGDTRSVETLKLRISQYEGLWKGSAGRGPSDTPLFDDLIGVLLGSYGFQG